VTIENDTPRGDKAPRHHVHAIFAAVPDTITRARHLLVRYLKAWGLTDLVLPLETAIGELLTNAIRHGRGPIELTMAALSDRIRVEVHDRGGGTPAIRPVHTSGPAIGGWGLRLVDHLTDAWGTHVTTGHTTVWVEQTIRG